MYHKVEITIGEQLREDRARLIANGQAVLTLEADALTQLSEMLDENFARAVELLLETQGRLIVSGMGKSGHIGRKMAATFSATGLPAFFVHPAEAAHGDLGMLTADDVLIALSNSGATPEMLPILDHARFIDCRIIAISGQRRSPMMERAHICLTLPQVPEACPVNISPTTSTTLMLALGDALAVTAMRARAVSREQLGRLHPGGSIGARVMPIDRIMHAGNRLPLVAQSATMHDVILVMTEKSFGMAGVVNDDGQLVGTITDGDLRRNIDGLLDRTAGEVMTRDPITIAQHSYAEDAFAMLTTNRITALFVMDTAARRRPVGLVHIHDLGRLGLSAAVD